MKFSTLLRTAVVPAALLYQVSLASALSIGQVDTFEDGTTQNWAVGLLGVSHPAPPTNVSAGGPAGVDDNFLLLTSVDGGGAGSKLAAVNLGAQWAGDYIGTGIGTISMAVNNLGTSDLALRLLFADPTVGPPTNSAFSSSPVLLAAGSGWTTISFSIAPGDLTAGLGTVAGALTNVTELRLYHSAAAAFPGEAIVAQLGVDNITALAGGTAVPEPSAFFLSGFGFLALLGLRHTALREPETTHTTGSFSGR